MATHAPLVVEEASSCVKLSPITVGCWRSVRNWPNLNSGYGSFCANNLFHQARCYRLGNRSALDWVIDQYRVERDTAGEITSDPNRADDEEYIVRLVGQVVTVSVETMKLVAALPALDEGGAAAKPAEVAGYTQAELDAAHVYVEEAPPADA